MDTIFKLIELEYRDDSSQYPSFDVFRNTIGYFSSLDKAGQEMKNFVKEDKRPLFGFLKEEYALDKSSLWWAKSRRNYLPDGEILDENLLSEMPEDGMEFFGRQEAKLRFHRGDIVEVLREDRVTLQIVISTPFSPEKVREMRECNKNPQLDFSDDSYCTLDISGDNYSQPNVVDVFPARFPVNEDLRRQFREVLLLEYIRKTVRQKLFFIKDIDDICQKLKFVS